MHFNFLVHLVVINSIPVVGFTLFLVRNFWNISDVLFLLYSKSVEDNLSNPPPSLSLPLSVFCFCVCVLYKVLISCTRVLLSLGPVIPHIWDVMLLCFQTRVLQILKSWPLRTATVQVLCEHRCCYFSSFMGFLLRCWVQGTVSWFACSGHH